MAGAQATISALTKLHDSRLLPHRFHTDEEKRLSHPGLGRRISAIRRGAGLTELLETELEGVAVRGTDEDGNPVRIEVGNGRLNIGPEESAPEREPADRLGIRFDRIIVADVRPKGTKHLLMIRWADAAEDLAYEVEASEIPETRRLIAALTDWFVSPDVPCLRTLVAALRRTTFINALIGTVTSLGGGLVILLAALANWRRRNSEALLGHSVACFAAGLTAMSVGPLTRVLWPSLVLAVLFLWQGSTSLAEFFNHQDVESPVPKGLCVDTFIAAVIGVVVIATLVWIRFHTGMSVRHFHMLALVMSFLPWTGVVLVLSQRWWPHLSFWQTIVIVLNAIPGVWMSMAVYLGSS